MKSLPGLINLNACRPKSQNYRFLFSQGKINRSDTAQLRLILKRRVDADSPAPAKHLKPDSFVIVLDVLLIQYFQLHWNNAHLLNCVLKNDFTKLT